METIIRDSDLDWTFVRPARLGDAPPTGACRVQDGENPSGGRQLALTDLAEFITRRTGRTAVDSPNPHARTVIGANRPTRACR
ncbi:NAD(P)H-binding protein [Nocardia brasiliensis]